MIIKLSNNIGYEAISVNENFYTRTSNDFYLDITFDGSNISVEQIKSDFTKSNCETIVATNDKGDENTLKGYTNLEFIQKRFSDAENIITIKLTKDSTAEEEAV